MRVNAAALLSIMVVAGCHSSDPAPEPTPSAAPVETSTTTPATPTTTPATGPRTLVEEGGTLTLAEAIKQIARNAGVNVVLEPSVTSTTPIDSDVRRQANAAPSARGALDLVAGSAGCEVEEGIHDVYEVKNHSRVDVGIEDLPARTALRLIAAFGGQSLVIERSIPDEPLDLTLDGVRWRQALDSVAATLGPFVVVQDGDVLRGKPRDDAGPQNNENETDTQLTIVAGALVSATPTKVTIQPDKAGDPAVTLYLPTDESAQARRLRSLLANIDERAPRLAVTVNPGRTITNAVVRAGKGAPR